MSNNHPSFDQDLLMVVTGNANLWQRIKVKIAMIFRRAARMRAQEFGLVSSAFAQAYTGHALRLGLGLSVRTLTLFGILVIVGTTALLMRPVITAEAAEATPASSRGEDCSTPKDGNKSNFKVTTEANDECVEARVD